MASQAIDFSDLGAKPVASAAPIDFSDLGAKKVVAPIAGAVPQGQMSAAPGGVKGWLSNLEADVTQGTGSTLPGRILQKMGAPGLQSGVPKGVSDYMGSPITGPIHTAQGVADIPQHPVQGALKTAGGVLETATIPASFISPQAAEAGAGAAASLASKIPEIPTAAKAASKFQDVMSVAKDMPVSLENSQDAAMKLMDWQKKTQLGPTVNKFLNRITNPNLGQLTYGEARDFQQILGKLSADEASKLPPAVRFDLTRMVVGLKEDVGQAAGKVGKYAEYMDAMKQYRQAMQLQQAADFAKEQAIKGVVAGAKTVGAGALAGLGYEAYKSLGK